MNTTVGYVCCLCFLRKLTFFVNLLDFHQLFFIARAHYLNKSLLISAQTLQNTWDCHMNATLKTFIKVFCIVW